MLARVDLARAADTDSLPRLLPARPLTGALRAEVEHFDVVEELPYPPSGEGDHLFVRFRKRDLNTPEAVRRVARVLEVEPRDCGWAGLKDRRAVTEQWASFLFGDASKLEGADIDGVEVLEAVRHNHKLRTGHVKVNRFRLVVTGDGSIDETASALEALVRRGVPNYFGAQRFGRGGANLERAARWLLEGGRKPRKRHERKLLVSTWQSAVFNELLAARVDAGELDRVVLGDLLRKEDSGGLFVCEEPEVDGPRAEAFEVSATGPMFGERMRWPEHEALAREESALARWGMEREALASFRSAGPGTRRPYRARIVEANVEAHPAGACVTMTLPSGVYATVVMRELLAPA